MLPRVISGRGSCTGARPRLAGMQATGAGLPATITGSAFDNCGSHFEMPPTNTDISSLPYKTPWNFYREGMILPVFVYLCLSVPELVLSAQGF